MNDTRFCSLKEVWFHLSQSLGQALRNTNAFDIFSVFGVSLLAPHAFWKYGKCGLAWAWCVHFHPLCLSESHHLLEEALYRLWGDSVFTEHLEICLFAKCQKVLVYIQLELWLAHGVVKGPVGSGKRLNVMFLLRPI